MIEGERSHNWWVRRDDVSTIPKPKKPEFPIIPRRPAHATAPSAHGRRRPRQRPHRANNGVLHSPVELVEQAVRARAKHSALDVSSSGGAQRMRSFIDEEIEQWNLDHRRGLRPFDLTDPELVAERAYRNLTGYGPLGPLLADDDVWEVMVNAPDGALH